MFDYKESRVQGQYLLWGAASSFRTGSGGVPLRVSEQVAVPSQRSPQTVFLRFMLSKIYCGQCFGNRTRQNMNPMANATEHASNGKEDASDDNLEIPICSETQRQCLVRIGPMPPLSGTVAGSRLTIRLERHK
jgi:hypothetical protein